MTNWVFMRCNTYFIGLLASLIIVSCNSDGGKRSSGYASGYMNVTAKSGLDFANVLDEGNMKNPFNYINAYTGGGVAIGDINNDGLPDVYLTGNMTSSKLFLNKGDMRFEDITASSGTATQGWCTAVTMADVNNDGWQDIYVCRSYHDAPQARANLLFINNKNGTFSEQGLQTGVGDANYSIGASFTDYDRDGDLDLVVANHPRFRLVSLTTHYNYWTNPVPEFSNKLFRNDGGTFVAVSYTHLTLPTTPYV